MILFSIKELMLYGIGGNIKINILVGLTESLSEPGKKAINVKLIVFGND
jgi:hypothetical protein